MLEKQMNYWNNLKRKYGALEGSQLFLLRYICRDKYYAILSNKLKLEFNNEISEFKINIKNYSNEKISKLEKIKVWFLWYQGYETMPAIVRRCYQQLEENLDENDFELILLSNENIKKYIEIPHYILDKAEKGNISLTHLSDIIRMMLLTEYGGMWIDSTCYSLKKWEKDKYEYSFYSQKFAVGNSRFFTGGKWSAYFMLIGENNCIPAFMKFLFLKYWENNDCLCEYFLIDVFLQIGYEELPEIKEQIDAVPVNNENVMYALDHWDKKFSDSVPKKYEQLQFLKTNWRKEHDYKKGTIGDYIINKVVHIEKEVLEK